MRSVAYALAGMVGIALLVSACGLQAPPAAGTSASPAGLCEAASPSPARQGGQWATSRARPRSVRSSRGRFAWALRLTPSPSACTARQFAIDTADGTTEVTHFALAADCTFRVALPPGTYRVRLVQTNPIERARNLPQTVVIAPGATARVDPDIDTEMR